MDKQKIRERQSKIRSLIKNFAEEKLNEEYAHVADLMLCRLARKAHGPLGEGDCEEWAAAIIHVSGKINSLFDKSSQPYVTVEEINRFFNTNPLTILARTRQVVAHLNITDWNEEFSIRCLEHSSAFPKLVMMNGCLVPMDCLPEEYH